jgi:hypothetical protein
MAIAEPTGGNLCSTMLDMNKNVVDDPDRLFVARATLLPDWLPKTCP